MFTTAKEFKLAACRLLIKIRDGKLDFMEPGIEQPYYGYLLEYLVQEDLVTGIHGGRIASGEYYASPASCPKITRKGRRFIKQIVADAD